MGTIQQSVQITDGMSPAFRAMNNAMLIVINSFERLQNTSHNAIDTSDIEAARNQLSIAGAEFTRIEEQISAATNRQNQFNGSINTGNHSANRLRNTVAGVVGAYAGLQGLRALGGLSDSYTQTNARLQLMNDNLQSVEELQNLIFSSAQRSRGAYLDTANMVAKLGVNAGEAFDSAAQIVAFAEQVNKQFAISGAGAQEASAASLQLTQALASGVLRGDELNSIFEQAPTLIRTIADYMGISVGEIRNLASEGAITADIVKNAMLSAADETNAKFEAMPLTWGNIWTSMTNIAVKASDVVLKKINDVANNEKFSNVVNGIMGSFTVIVNVASGVIGILGAVGEFMYDNWSIIAPLITGVAVALALYTAVLVVHNTVQGISNGLKGLAAIAAVAHGTATAAEMAATTGMTAAQLAFNAALYACPLTWIVIAVIAIIAVIYMVIAVINKAAGTSVSATGFIAGAFATAGAAIYNVLLGIQDIILGVIETAENLFIDLANFLANVFNDPVASVIRLFENLIDAVMNVIQHIASALDKVFGGNLEYQVEVARSNWASKADSMVAKYGNGTYKEAQHVDIYEQLGIDPTRMNYGDAYNAGYNWGANLESKLKDMFSAADLDFNGADLEKYNDILKNVQNAASDTEAIKDNTDTANQKLSSISDSLSLIKNFAEREVINQFTTQSVKVEMNNVNSISSDMDIDGMTDKLLENVIKAANGMAEGVHA